jgi:hypothetical protein
MAASLECASETRSMPEEERRHKDKEKTTPGVEASLAQPPDE